MHGLVIDRVGGHGIWITNAGDKAAVLEGDVQITGDLNITGMITKGSGTFKIDHPSDPYNKYLSHSFVESPDMMNVYNGNVILGSDGSADITLPDYFDSLNKDCRYQLTAIGGFAPVYIENEIKNNQFSIAGGEAGMKISWQVTGIRKDLYSEYHRIEVEADKHEDKKGTLMHPEAYQNK